MAVKSALSGELIEWCNCKFNCSWQWVDFTMLTTDTLWIHCLDHRWVNQRKNSDCVVLVCETPSCLGHRGVLWSKYFCLWMEILILNLGVHNRPLVNVTVLWCGDQCLMVLAPGLVVWLCGCVVSIWGGKRMTLPSGMLFWLCFRRGCVGLASLVLFLSLTAVVHLSVHLVFGAFVQL